MCLYETLKKTNIVPTDKKQTANSQGGAAGITDKSHNWNFCDEENVQVLIVVVVTCVYIFVKTHEMYT